MAIKEQLAANNANFADNLLTAIKELPAFKSQEKIVTPVPEGSEVVPDTGFLLSKVVLDPIPTQTKTVTAGVSAVTITPDEDYLIDSIVVNPTPSQSKTVTPVPEGMVVTPDAGKLLAEVILNGFELPSPEGQYLWKRNIANPNCIRLSFTQLNEDVTPVRFQVTSSTTDVSELGSDFFSGKQIARADAESLILEFGAGSVQYAGNKAKVYDFDPLTGIITIQMSFGSIFPWSDWENGEKPYMLLDYVVSDNPNEYPDRALQDGYWYERVEGYSSDEALSAEILSCSKMAIDTFTLTSNAQLTSYTFTHSLGELPKAVILMSGEVFPTDVSTTYVRGFMTNFVIPSNPSYTEVSFNVSGHYIHTATHNLFMGTGTGTSTIFKVNAVKGYSNHGGSSTTTSNFYMHSGDTYTLITMA